MDKIKNINLNKLYKIKFTFFTLISILLLTLEIFLIIDGELVQNIILYTTMISLFGLVLYRLVIIILNRDEKIKVITNAIETIINLVAGIALVYIAVSPNTTELLTSLYCYLISLCLFTRGIVFLIEGLYCDEEKIIALFLIHLGFIICATVFVAREMNLNDLKLVIQTIIIFVLVYTIYEVIKYIKLLRKSKKEIEIEKDEE